jgi:hypothetical protein
VASRWPTRRPSPGGHGARVARAAPRLRCRVLGRAPGRVQRCGVLLRRRRLHRPRRPAHGRGPRRPGRGRPGAGRAAAGARSVAAARSRRQSFAGLGAAPPGAGGPHRPRAAACRPPRGASRAGDHRPPVPMVAGDGRPRRGRRLADRGTPRRLPPPGGAVEGDGHRPGNGPRRARHARCPARPSLGPPGSPGPRG